MSGLERRLGGLHAALGHRFRRPELLQQALTHPSVDADPIAGHYERLEFLGDRVLGLVIARLLYERHPDEREGSLARRHAALVRAEALARVARTLDLGSHVILSEGEEAAGGRAKPSVLANCCEAVIGALYLDGGLNVARGFIRRNWAPLMDEAPDAPRDPKTALQEWAQGRGLPVPDYAVVAREGPDHAPAFAVEARVRGLPAVAGEGRSKREAEQAAAAKLLEAARRRTDG